MAWAFVSAAANGDGSENSVTKSVTAGNLLVFVRVMQTGTDTPTISDGVNSWTQVSASPTQDTTNGAGVAMWAAVAATTASITVTVSSSSNTGFCMNSLLEYSGGPATVQLDGSAGTGNITGSSAANGMQTGSFSTAADGDLIVSVIDDDQGQNVSAQWTAGTSPITFTKRTTGSVDPGSINGNSAAVQDGVQTTHGSINPAWTGTAAHHAVALSAAFKISAGTSNPFKQTDFPNPPPPPKPAPFEPNNLLISTLSLPALKPFKINSDWPNPIIPPKPQYWDPPNILATTLSIPVVSTPFKQQDWPLPTIPPRLGVQYGDLSWWYYYVIDDNVPFYPTQLDNPPTTTALSRSVAYFDPENLILGTLSPPAVQPFKRNYDFPNPAPAPLRSLDFYPENLFHNTLKPTPLYAVQFDNPPAAPTRWVQFDPENLLFSTLKPAALSPFKINSDWPLPPQGPGRWVQFDPENLLFSTLRPKVAITIRNFHGNTFTQVVDRTPGLYVIGPPQFTIANVIPSATIQLFPGPHQGLYIREREAIYTPDGNVWFRWEEDQPSASTPGSYTAGVF